MRRKRSTGDEPGIGMTNNGLAHKGVGNRKISSSSQDDLSRRRFLTAAGAAGAAAGMLALGQPGDAEASICGESCFNVKDLGATGNGSTDDSAAFQKGLSEAAAAGGGVLIVPKGTYRIDSPLTYEGSNLEVACEPGAVIDFSNAPTKKAFLSVIGKLTFSGTGVETLTNDAAKGAASVSCAAGGESEFNVNDYVMITSAISPLTYPSTALFTPNTVANGSMDQRLGEIGVVSSTSSGSVALRWPLLDGPYLTSDSAVISKLTLRKNIKWVGGEIIGGGLGKNHTGFFFHWCLHVQVIGTILTNWDDRAIELASVLHGLVDGITVFGGASTATFYGVACTHASQWCQVVNSTFRDCYHALDCGGTSSVFDPGINRFITWANNHSYDATGAAFNTHAGAEHLTIVGNTAVNAAGPGVLLRSPSAVIQGNTFMRTAAGVSVRNQSYRPSSYLIADNRIIDAVNEGIIWVTPAESVLDGTVAGKAIDGVVITGNEVSGCGDVAIMIYSTEPWPLHSASITGNIVRRPGYHAIRVYNATDIALSGNTVDEVPKDRNAIRIEAAGRITVVANNLATVAGSGGTAVGGLGASECIVSGNMCTAFWAGASTDAGSVDWIVEGNHLKGCEIAYNLLGTGHFVGRNFGGNTATVASASTMATLKGSENDVFEVTGTTTIESIGASWRGRLLTLRFREAVSILDGSNLKLAGNFNATSDDTLTLVSDGANWLELSRSIN